MAHCTSRIHHPILLGTEQESCVIAGPAGWWPNNYSQTIFNIEKLVRFFYLHTNAINWQPGYFERHGPGEHSCSLVSIVAHRVIDNCKVLSVLVLGTCSTQPIPVRAETPADAGMQVGHGIVTPLLTGPCWRR